MASIERTAYPRFKSALTAHELDELYCPTEEDLEFVYQRADDPAQRLTLLARLKCHQHLGYLSTSEEEDVSNVLMWYSLRSSLEPLPSTPSSNIMIIQVLHCPHCQGTDIVRHGNTCQGKQRYRCRECREGRGRTFLLDYSYAGQSPEIKEQIVEMAMNASGIRDTARVLHVSTNTVMTELKKRNLNSTR